MRTLTYAIAVIAFLGSSAVQADIYAFTDVALTPEQETTLPQSDGKGWFNALYNSDNKTLTYVVNWQLKSGNTLSASHFHGPGAIGVSAGVQMGVTLPNTSSGKSGGSVTLTSTQEADLLAGKWYFNIHSAPFPSGELRGQLVENSGSYNGSVFNSSTGAITFTNIQAPGVGIFDATLKLKSDSPTTLFEVTNLTKVR